MHTSHKASAHRSSSALCTNAHYSSAFVNVAACYPSDNQRSDVSDSPPPANSCISRHHASIPRARRTSAMLSEVAHARARAILLVAALAPPAVLLRFVITDSFDGGRVASSNSALPPSLASNFLGTALLGALSAFGSVLPNALNAGLASGFCASLTTFGSAMFHAARLFVIGLPERGFTSLMLTLFSAPSIYVTVRDAASLI
eukprot:IDg18305t1